MSCGLVLAAGAATRFGSPKQLAELDGRPLLQHAVDAMLGAPGVERAAVVLGHAADRVRAAVDLAGVEAVECPDWREGMAASLRCGLAALGPCEHVVVTLGDQPEITAAAIGAVLAACGEGVAAARATYDGAPGHPVALGPALLARAGELRGDAGFRELLADADVRAVEVGHLARPDDVDTPAELEAMLTTRSSRRRRAARGR